MTDIFGRCRAWSAYRAQLDPAIYPYFRSIASRQDGTEVEVDGRRLIMAGSNDYLGLSCDPRVIDAAARALARFGTSCSGSRLLNGTLTLHEELESEMARFLGRSAAVVVTTGFQTNLAVAALLDRDSVVFADRHNHASLVDAVQLGASKHRRYRHNDMAHLRHLLETTESAGSRLIITDGAFSMGGDICDLPQIVKLAQMHSARVVVDGAHDVGLLGERGRGVAEHFGVEEQVDLVITTLSKCFGSLGGVFAGPAEVIDYARHHARSIVFAASLPPANVAAALAALRILESEPERRRRAFQVAEQLNNGLRAVGFNTGDSVTPVVPVRAGSKLECLRFWSELFAAGIFVNAVLPPAAPEGTAVIRITLSALHTDQHIDRIIEECTAVGRRLGFIPSTPPISFERVKMACSV
ncbi:2-amino-3-ketobutyrate CoA ligase [Longimycelium tulufanense]|uniref:8-amino-7-oxononanoate synthase n=1 Tax=Longimycelium tulufanense TaxID=907463 RepID=A0A8J3FU07_9PSEU|nr:aminotransferase class I/II-fold pyridoxal phosphate-dependent enzyme [Longimycelium tulufanense]GGM51169.1 2-amino-3-ketobutyrate CoA ligase [Longimycelium tulufanense]